MRAGKSDRIVPLSSLRRPADGPVHFRTRVRITNVIVQELRESRGGRPELSVLTNLLVSVDVKNYCTMLRHWSQLVPNMSADI